MQLEPPAPIPDLEIEDILVLIDDIADQTELLAVETRGQLLALWLSMMGAIAVAGGHVGAVIEEQRS